ncbi:Fic family protein [Bradyrhizobium brasilense]|uniref:Fic family protein n=1 Tax=Bradyrhizobium brasilense TaxID=1419277 RepID=UPI0024B2203C|nr:Fic family protein [Bradyrhizobium australafricanum]WFU32402.1 Fic family protein [Bradyrhizobium australafricanum]
MHPISKLLCDAYSELHKQGQVSFPLHDKHRASIDTVVKTVHANYFGLERYPMPQDKAVAYLCYIIKNHPVTDGNKRLALLWFRVYCDVNNLEPQTSVISLDELAVAIEKEKLLSMSDILRLVQKVLFPVDSDQDLRRAA